MTVEQGRISFSWKRSSYLTIQHQVVQPKILCMWVTLNGLSMLYLYIDQYIWLSIHYCETVKKRSWIWGQAKVTWEGLKGEGWGNLSYLLKIKLNKDFMLENMNIYCLIFIELLNRRQVKQVIYWLHKKHCFHRFNSFIL